MNHRICLTAFLVLSCATAWASPQEPRAKVSTVDETQARTSAQRPTLPRTSREAGRPGSFEISVSAVGFLPSGLGTQAAELTSNGGGPVVEWFSSSGELGAAVGGEARVTYNLARRLALEGGATISRPAVSFRVESDLEGGGGFSGRGERLAQYFLDGSLLVYLPALSFSGGRGRTFVAGGAGYLRQLHRDSVAVHTGAVYHAGAGIRYFFGGNRSGVVKGLGLRAEARLYFGSGAFNFGRDPTRTLTVGSGLVVAF